MPAKQDDPASSRVRLPYLPGLDGLRAIAVIGVLLYHAEQILRGGFLGVETFFVLSGFLITALLLGEWREYGRIALSDFWMRRARRLLPALFLVLIGTLLLVVGLNIVPVRTIGVDLLASLGYVMNWRLIMSGQSYFDPLVRPSLLQHLWSLAIEEQFYLLWPLLFALGMRYLRRGGVLVLVIAGVVASTLLMASLYQPGVDPSRVYYGTDTRASGLLLGCVLGLVWSPWRTVGAEKRKITWLLDALGLASLAGLVYAYVRLYESHPLLYRGGFTLTAIATAGVILAVSHPGTRIVSSVLGGRVLCWIGKRSYGLYLWHWPVFLVTRPIIDVPLSGWPLLAMRLTIVVILTELSYRYVEVPIQRGALNTAWRRGQVTGWGWFGQARRRVLQYGLSPRPALIIMVMSLPALVAGSALPKGHDAETVIGLTAIDHIPVLEESVSQVASEPASAEPSATATPLPSKSSSTDVPATAIPETAEASIPTSVGSDDTVPAPAASAATETPPPQNPEATGPLQAPIDSALAAQLQRILDETVADGLIPGVVLSVSIPGHEPWTSAGGLADRQDGRPMEPHSNIRIGSISKMFLAVVVLQLAEEGTLELDAPVETYLPGLLPQGDVITVRHLLQHRSGLYDYLEDRSFVTQAYQNPSRNWSPTELVSYAKQFAPAFPPGAEGRWSYSSTNYVILGMLVEQVTGNTLAAEVQQRILEPLALNQTYVLLTDAMPESAATGHADTTTRTEISMSFGFATANIVSTAGDVRRFIEALMHDELLMPETRKEMFTFVNAHGQYNMSHLEYGLGIMRNRLPVGADPSGEARPTGTSRAVGHIGGFGGFRAAVWTVPENGITISLGVNQTSTDPNTLATRVLDAILTYQGR